jgi:ubiquitin-protein ligase E3 C
VQLFSEDMDMGQLSEAVITYHPHGSAVTGEDNGLWLIAHFIALLRAKGGSLHSSYLRALYIQLSALASQIRICFASPGEAAATESENSLPSYVHDQLSSLVRKEGLSDLLKRFTL